MPLGICRNAACPTAPDPQPVELYPGPGLYCPECGERLQTHERPPTPRPPRPARPVLPRLGRPALFAVLAVLLASGSVLAALHPRTAPAAALRPCSSTMSRHVADDLFAAYLHAHGSSESGTTGGPCTVQFSAWPGIADAPSTIAHDAVVAVVHPQNPVSRLSLDQLRGILTGAITDWSQLGGPRGALVAVMPGEGSDEAVTVGKLLLRGAPITAGVRRVTSTAEVVAAVSGTQGANLLGIASFSGAVPAKVLALGDGSPPSPLAIRERRYPLAVSIAVYASGPTTSDASAELIRYAQSKDAQSIAARDGLVTLHGF